MTAQEAIRILHPDTTKEAIAEIKYYCGFHGKEAAVKAIEEACLLACDALEKQVPKEQSDTQKHVVAQGVMAKEYIDREALLKNLNRFAQDNYCVTINDVIMNLPAADVAEVVHGEWLLRHIGAGHYWECSVCHTNPCIYVTEHTKFCPNCGAKMDGGEENAAD